MFISYAHGGGEDEHVKALRHRLEYELRQRIGAADLDVFQDVNDINPGLVWKKRLNDKLRHAHALVVLMSPLWFTRVTCISEFETYRKLHGPDAPMFPIRWVSEEPIPQNDRALEAWQHLRALQSSDWTEIRQSGPSSDAMLRATHALAGAIAERLHKLQDLTMALPLAGDELEATPPKPEVPVRSPPPSQSRIDWKLATMPLLFAASFLVGFVYERWPGPDESLSTWTVIDRSDKAPAAKDTAPEWITGGTGARYDGQRRMLHGVGASSKGDNPAWEHKVSDRRALSALETLMRDFRIRLLDALVFDPQGRPRQVVLDAATATLARATVVERWTHPEDGTRHSLAQLDVGQFIEAIRRDEALPESQRKAIVYTAKATYDALAIGKGL
ncbi:MAG: toll/interleukin-1 receptor domain-containing protein [Deltaproteobacteria bacterium]